MTPVGQTVAVAPAGGADVFHLQVAGAVGGKPFDVVRDVDYSDLAFKNFPSDNETYRGRVGSALNEAADAICALAHTDSE